ncbi:hypothetical protein HMPREF3103_03445 [Granulicatella sp. HMSC30F09]|jgi:hypothetical protein|uniref:DUF6161 domain-containing protein n=1 Tax=Granulicatella sp. HMSC30F09 TaxID=1581071 RepID=UPI0008A3F5E9|nr:DUF6161 domain-containing protein [Granulicatella sp. HMSC30F09]OFT80619.1 hypothetical protein HMPREF3103_03445 [Granulicatella sp. HMSC30F09]
MGFTKKQISNFLDDKILFRFSIEEEYVINYNRQSEEYTFDELEKIAKSNFEYWDSVSEDYFSQEWANLSRNITRVREYLSTIEELDLQNIRNYFYNNIPSNREEIDKNKYLYIISIKSPIDKDTEFGAIKNFVSFYTQHFTNYLNEAVKNFIRLSKNMHEVGHDLTSTYRYDFYPALYLLKQHLSDLKESKDNFETNIVLPIKSKLQEISDDSDEQYKEITTFIETKHNEIQKQFDEKTIELKEFQSSMDTWKEQKQAQLNDLEETYKNKLSLEAPEKHWHICSKEYREKAKSWTWVLIVAVLVLICSLAGLVMVIHDYSLDTIQEIPFVSKSFILISIISFFVYIIRVLIKIVMSNHHLATEYEQKAALTRFYQALTKAGTDITKEERIIIIHSLFSKTETGLVKTDSSNDVEAILSVLSKNAK